MLSENLKYLRKNQSLSQQVLANDLSIPRTTLGDYERGYTEPNIETLLRIATYYKVSIDELLRSKLEYADPDGFGKKDLQILAISLDAQQKENIELVDTKAEAGYLDSFQDPEYIRDLPKIKFPNIPSGTFRGFEIQGDSMLPIEPGSIIISQYVEKIKDIKEGHTYIVVSKENGLVYKRIRRDDANNKLHLFSDNETYLPYTLEYSEIDEIWKYYAHLSFSDSRDTFNALLQEKINDIHRKVTDLHDNM